MGAHADTAALSLPVNTRIADCIANAITHFLKCRKCHKAKTLSTLKKVSQGDLVGDVFPFMYKQ